MNIKHVEISNFRALETISIPLNAFSVLLGENDVGKSSFLYALEKYFLNKKLSEQTDWFKEDIAKDIRIVLTFGGLPESDVRQILRRDGSVVISKVFPFDKAPQVKAILDDDSAVDVPAAILKNWLGPDRFHFIPVRRDLSVQFSMGKTALLGKTLRAKMKQTLESDSAVNSLADLEGILTSALAEPKATLQTFLREQMSNPEIKLGFDELEIDPIEGVRFIVRLSDDRVDNILIENRGAGTQNNLIIALFRLIAELEVGGSLIFAMEEPENSLHPKAQRQLLAVIQEISQNSQVIVTTHSPVFIDRSKFENNILLTRTLQGCTMAKTFDTGALDQVRTDLGIRASDALLKGGGNCAILVEGRTEEDGFPTFMEMLGMSEFQLGIAIINMQGSDFQKVRNTAQLLHAYDIPCVVVLDANAKQTAIDLAKLREASLPNIREIFCLSEGNIEDYYPLDIVAEVINRQFSPNKTITKEDFDSSKHGNDRLSEFKRVMFENGAGDSVEYLKRQIGGLGTRLLKERGIPVSPELAKIFEAVQAIAAEG